MYDDKPARFEGKLDPYPHSELGVEVRRRGAEERGNRARGAEGCCCCCRRGCSALN
jgi:hypothetical protein